MDLNAFSAHFELGSESRLTLAASSMEQRFAQRFLLLTGLKTKRPGKYHTENRLAGPKQIMQ